MTFKLIIKLASTLILSSFVTMAMGAEFSLPEGNNALIGEVQYAVASETDTPTTVAEQFNLGLNSIVAANPGATERRLYKRNLKIPTVFLLPPFAHEGIIINLPEMRLYYYPVDSDIVLTYPIGIGKIGKTIPIKNTTVTRKKVNPSWIPGPDVRRYNEDQGIELPKVMGPGPDNPLGPYAIYLNIPSFLIHSTIFPESIGRRASFGCIRMNEKDIKEFFPLVTPGTPVVIVNMPFKAGWNGDKLFFEAHPQLEEMENEYSISLEDAVSVVQKVLPQHALTIVDWQLIAHLAQHPDGVPHEVGSRVD